MKAKLLIGALILVIGFTSCATTYYVTSPSSRYRHQGYKKQDGNYGRDSYYYRGGWNNRYGRGNQWRGGRYRGW